MTSISSGTVLITGPTGGLGKAATLAIAHRRAPERPDLLLVGRAGRALTDVADAARAAGATVHEIGCDLARLAEVREAGQRVKHLLDAGAAHPLRGLVANAGVSSADTRTASADGYELTFAVNYLAHAQLIGDLLGSFVTPARIVLLGSNTLLPEHVSPDTGNSAGAMARSARACPARRARRPGDIQASLARLLEFQTGAGLLRARIATPSTRRHQCGGIRAGVHAGHRPREGPEPGHSTGRGARWRRIPGVSSPVKSGPALASIALDDRWAHLRGGAFVVKTQEREVKPFASDPRREARLWEATAELLTA